MILSLIVAHGTNYELGLNNKLLWHIPEDLKKFRELTNGHHILMGRKTFESIGRPLPNRTTLVVTSDAQQSDSWVGPLHFFQSIEEAVGYATSKGEQELFIVGGAQIYSQFIDLVDKIYVSEIDFNGEADTFLTPPNYDAFKLVEKQLYLKSDITPQWVFKIYNRK